MLYRENGQFKSSYREDLRIFPVRQDRIAVGALAGAAFVLVPWLAGDYLFQAVLTPFLILALAALGLNVLVGWCGQISLGSAAFMAVGAYAAYNLQARIPGLPLPVALVGGGVAAMLVGVAFGVPSLRIRGLYLAVATLAAQFFVDWFANRVKWVTHDSPSGSVGVGALQCLGLPVQTPVQKYLFCLAVVALVALAIENLARGAIGRQWMAIRDMDVAAEVIGIRPVHAKLTAFAVSSFVLGLAGVLWAFVHLGSWEPAAFGIDRSLSLLFMVIIGGLGSISGAFLGAAFIVLLPLALNRVPHALGLPISTATAAHVEHMVFGALIVAFLVWEPHGLARLWMTGREKLRLWPFPH